MAGEDASDDSGTTLALFVRNITLRATLTHNEFRQILAGAVENCLAGLSTTSLDNLERPALFTAKHRCQGVKMRQKFAQLVSSSVRTVRDINRATRRHYSADGKIRVVPATATKLVVMKLLKDRSFKSKKSRTEASSQS